MSVKFVASMTFAVLLATGCSSMAPLAHGPSPGADMIVVRSTAKSPDDVVESLKSYASSKKWAFLGANKVKNGEITMAKVCIPAVGAALWTANLQLTALLPCGNVSVYARGGRTEIAMLHPAYMQVLYPGKETEAAVALATPQLMAMMDEVAR